MLHELFPFLQPLIGQIPRLDNLHLLTGLSSSGFEKGLMAGKLLAESINHGTAAPHPLRSRPCSAGEHAINLKVEGAMG